MDKSVHVGYFCVLRMSEEQTGLYIWAQSYVGGVECIDEILGVGHFRFVPLEHIPFAVGTAGITTAHMEHRAGDVVLLAEAQEIQQLSLSVLSLSVKHSRSEITQGVLRRHAHVTGQSSKLLCDLFHRRTKQQVVIHIPILAMEVSIGSMVGVNFISHVESTVSIRIIQNSIGDAKVLYKSNVEGIMFVERVGGLGVVPKCIHVDHSHPPSTFVQFA
mmetsp:Transcript_30089/g.48619  ORF Transcript_30089/g.48619 Transcript_30089/m.48619 type:complete len:217 (+) Transcript_30089:1480-2130(+)